MTQRMQQLMNNMTAHLNEELVLATCSALILMASGIGLYALDHGAGIASPFFF